MKRVFSAVMFILLVTSILTLTFNSSISQVRAQWVSDSPIPFSSLAFQVTVDGEIVEEAWNYATHFHNYSTNNKTIEFDVFLIHNAMSLYIAAEIHSNDFGSNGVLGDSFEVEINDRNDGHYGGNSGNDVKRILVTPTGLGIYEDKWIPSDESQDTQVDGEGAFTFSGIKQDGEIGDYYFELSVPISGDPPEDAKLLRATPFGMMISFTDYDPAEGVGDGYWLLQGSFVLDYELKRELSVFSAHGLPSPSVGSWLYGEGQYVTCQVPLYSPEGEVVWACTGWTGTGSVPPSGNANGLIFQIYGNSTITWNWQIVQTDTFLTFEKSSYQFMVDREFDVAVTVRNVSDLNTWQLSLNFDPNIIEYVNVSIPPDNVFGSQELIVGGPDIINASDGFVTLGACLGFGGTDFDGSGKLCTFRFIGKSVGNTSLTFLNFGWDTFLLNANLVEILFKPADSLAHSILFQGDVNNDGIVNMRDVNDAILAFNSFLGGVRWNPAADLDNSGRVDMRDLVIIVLNFNKHE